MTVMSSILFVYGVSGSGGRPTGSQTGNLRRCAHNDRPGNLMVEVLSGLSFPGSVRVRGQLVLNARSHERIRAAEVGGA